MIAGLSMVALASIVLAMAAGFGFVSPWLILGLGFLAEPSTHRRTGAGRRNPGVFQSVRRFRLYGVQQSVASWRGMAQQMARAFLSAAS